MSIADKWSKKYDMCISCNSTKHKHKAKGLCELCYQRNHEYPKKVCSLCNQLKRVHSNINNKPVCKDCYSRPKHICCLCNRMSYSALTLPGDRHICYSCYNQDFRKKYICSECGKESIIVSHNNNLRLCSSCYETSSQYCDKCGRTIKSPYLFENAHICKRCYTSYKNNDYQTKIDINAIQYPCTICKNTSNIHRLYRDGSVICQNCFNSLSRICNLCSDPDLQIYSHLNARPYCRYCYFKVLFNQQIFDMKKKYDSTFLDLIIKYYCLKSKYISYEAITRCITSTEDILKSLNKSYINSNFSFSENDLMSFGRTNLNSHMFLDDFINYLHNENLIKEFSKAFRSLNSLDIQIHILPSTLRKTLLLYKEFLISKYNNLKDKGWVDSYCKFSYYTCYQYMLTSIRFIKEIYNNFSIHQITQLSDDILFSYLALKPYERGNLRHFIKFINKNHLVFMKLKLPKPNYSTTVPYGIPEDQQKKIFEKCIKDNSISFRNRVIVTLTLIFGLLPSNIQQLKKDNFSIVRQKKLEVLRITLNKCKYDIPHPVSDLIIQYLNSTVEGSTYLFPGRFFEQPLTTSSIYSITKKFGVTPTQLYYTAISNAFLDGLHIPSMFMKRFGIHYITATKYCEFHKSGLDYI